MHIFIRWPRTADNRTRLYRKEKNSESDTLLSDVIVTIVAIFYIFIPDLVWIIIVHFSFHFFRVRSKTKTTNNVPSIEDSGRTTFTAGRLAVPGSDPRRPGRDILLRWCADIWTVGPDRGSLHRRVITIISVSDFSLRARTKQYE